VNVTGPVDLQSRRARWPSSCRLTCRAPSSRRSMNRAGRTTMTCG